MSRYNIFYVGELGDVIEILDEDQPIKLTEYDIRAILTNLCRRTLTLEQGRAARTIQAAGKGGT